MAAIAAPFTGASSAENPGNRTEREDSWLDKLRHKASSLYHRALARQAIDTQLAAEKVTANTDAEKLGLLLGNLFQQNLVDNAEVGYILNSPSDFARICLKGDYQAEDKPTYDNRIRYGMDRYKRAVLVEKLKPYFDQIDWQALTEVNHKLNEALVVYNQVTRGSQTVVSGSEPPPTQPTSYPVNR